MDIHVRHSCDGPLARLIELLVRLNGGARGLTATDEEEIYRTLLRAVERAEAAAAK